MHDIIFGFRISTALIPEFFYEMLWKRYKVICITPPNKKG